MDGMTQQERRPFPHQICLITDLCHFLVVLYMPKPELAQQQRKWLWKLQSWMIELTYGEGSILSELLLSLFCQLQ